MTTENKPNLGWVQDDRDIEARERLTQGAPGAITGSPNTDSHEFIVTTNREHAEWFRAMFVPECEIDLKSLWAWQEQERRKRAALASLPAGDGLTDREILEAVKHFADAWMFEHDPSGIVRDIRAIVSAHRQPMQLPESMSRDESLAYYSQYANVCANEALQYQKRIRELEAQLAAPRQPGEAKKLDADLLATIREAAKTRSEGAITQDGRTVFINYGDSEDQMREADAVACPHCGGSGHKDDVVSRQPGEMGAGAEKFLLGCNDAVGAACCRLAHETGQEQPTKSDDMVLVRREMVAAACHAIDKQRPAPTVLKYLRAVAIDAAASAQQDGCERCGLAPSEHAGAHWCDNQSFASAQQDTWERFAAWLLDHCEGKTITEEFLQEQMAEMLASLKGVSNAAI